MTEQHSLHMLHVLIILNILNTIYNFCIWYKEASFYLKICICNTVVPSLPTNSVILYYYSGLYLNIQKRKWSSCLGLRSERH